MDFSHTKFQTFADCQRKFKHTYIKHIATRKRPTYFVLGEAVHKFIEMFYRTQDVKLAARQVDRVFDGVPTTLMNREERHAFEVDRNIALGIAKAYPNTYKEDFDIYTQFLTEQEFRFPLDPLRIEGETHHYKGYIDVFVRDSAGDWWIMETKTVSPQSVNPDYFTRVKIDSQVMGYMWAGKHILGTFPKGVVYNVIKKPGIRLRKGESLAAFQKRVYLEYTKMAKVKGYFTRQELIVPTTRLQEWLRDAQRQACIIANQVANNGDFWPMNTGACQAKFGSCAFLPACTTRKYNKLLYVKEDRRSGR